MEGSICIPRALVFYHPRFHYSSTLCGRLTTADTTNLISRNSHPRHRQLKKSAVHVAASFGEFTTAADPVQAGLTWQIVVGSIAGVTPFVVAGIEFSKRIVAQRNCKQCGGSGLVIREKKYFRCPGCGGFLPWQSWKRFFSG